MIKRYATAVSAVLTGIALLAGCGNGGSSGTPPVETTSTGSSPSSDTTHERAIPEQVIVYQPGLVDTNATVDDVPAWPGPPLTEFMDSTGPWGPSGTLTGPDAQVVYEAAVEHGDPDALLEEGEEPSDASGSFWGLDNVVVLLIVQPQW